MEVVLILYAIYYVALLQGLNNNLSSLTGLHTAVPSMKRFEFGQRILHIIELSLLLQDWEAISAREASLQRLFLCSAARRTSREKLHSLAEHRHAGGTHEVLSLALHYTALEP
jgi:hypothetical protein